MQSAIIYEREGVAQAPGAASRGTDATEAGDLKDLRRGLSFERKKGGE